MNLFVSSKVFSPGQSVHLVADDASSNVKRLARRLSTAKTLDGGISVTDFGYFDASRPLEFTIRRPTEAQSEIVSNLVRVQSRVIVSFYDGCYECVIDSASFSRQEIRLNFIVVERKDR